MIATRVTYRVGTCKRFFAPPGFEPATSRVLSGSSIGRGFESRWGEKPFASAPPPPPVCPPSRYHLLLMSYQYCHSISHYVTMDRAKQLSAALCDLSNPVNIQDEVLHTIRLNSIGKHKVVI